MSNFLRGLALGGGGLVVVALAYTTLLIHEAYRPSCEALAKDAELTLQAVAACANAPGCQFTSESIRVALEKKAAAESCK